ncbi:MAG: DUF4474 domain-containing protein [Clostridia bacterium]|nr:DUF4474 domain-containing protein [Clostridia bacterium]
MNFEKNKSSIIIVVALLVVCIGSFFGVSAMTRSDNVVTTNTTLPPTTQATTAPTTTSAPVPTTQPVATTAPSTSEAVSTSSNLITTFPGVSSSTTTEAPTTTEPSTTYSTTTESSSQDSQSTTQSDELIENAAIFDEGFLSYMFNPEGNYYYTNSDPWQRALGYNEFYDVGAGFVAIYMDTMRCKFSYGDQDWMIQFWKGQYGFLFVGHEIGVYTKPKDRDNEHYDAASNDDALYMSMTGYRKGEELYTREYGKYWWCTGFVPGKLDNFSDRSELELKCRITMRDYNMLLGFCGALKENGLVLGEDFTTSGLDVFVTW